MNVRILLLGFTITLAGITLALWEACFQLSKIAAGVHNGDYEYNIAIVLCGIFGLMVTLLGLFLPKKTLETKIFC